MKYLYSANIKGQPFECAQIPKLVKKINEIYEFPIVSNNVLYNYFTRPQQMKSRNGVLAPLFLERTMIPCASMDDG